MGIDCQTLKMGWKPGCRLRVPFLIANDGYNFIIQGVGLDTLIYAVLVLIRSSEL